MQLQIDFGNGYITGVNCNIIEHEGLESAEPEAFVRERALRNGAVWSGGRHKARRLTFTVDFGFVDWRTVLESFKSLYQYTLHVTRDYDQYSIEGIIDTEIERAIDGGVNDPVVLQISYICPYPYFNQGSISIVASGVSTGGLTYPHIYPFQFESYTGASTAFLPNDSNQDIAVQLVIKASTSIANLVVSIGEVSQTLGPLDANETITVDSDLMLADIDGVNCLNQISWDFVYVPAGGAFFSMFDGETPINTPYATVTYTPTFERI